MEEIKQIDSENLEITRSVSFVINKEVLLSEKQALENRLAEIEETIKNFK